MLTVPCYILSKANPLITSELLINKLTIPNLWSQAVLCTTFSWFRKNFSIPNKLSIKIAFATLCKPNYYVLRICTFALRSFALVTLLKRTNRSSLSSRFLKSERAICSFQEWFALSKSGRWKENFKIILFTLLSPFLCPKQVQIALVVLLKTANRSHPSL